MVGWRNSKNKLERTTELGHGNGHCIGQSGRLQFLSAVAKRVFARETRAMKSPTDDLGRRLPFVETDHVHVYSSNLSLSLGSDAERTFETVANATGNQFGTSLIDPPLSPGPPLRGYASVPLGAPAAAETKKEERRAAQQRESDAEYQQMMQSILDRTKQQNAAQEQDEDRRLERLLKHIAHEQEFVDQVRRTTAQADDPRLLCRESCSERATSTRLTLLLPLVSSYAQIDYNLSMRERAKYRRQTELYKEWKEKVYETVQSQIDSQLAQLRTEDISARRRQLMEDYIRVSNQKRYGLYRDIIIESEYDPLIAHRQLLKYTCSTKNDPCKQEINATMLGKPKLPLGAPSGSSHAPSSLVRPPPSLASQD